MLNDQAVLLSPLNSIYLMLVYVFQISCQPSESPRTVYLAIKKRDEKNPGDSSHRAKARHPHHDPSVKSNITKGGSLIFWAVVLL